MKADYVFPMPEHMDIVLAAAEQADVATENLFVLDQPATDEGVSDAVRNWSCLLDLTDGPGFEWKRLSDEKVKMTTALLTHTSGTTGLPKLAERTHCGLIGNTEQLLYRYHLKERNKHETFFCTFLFAGIGFILYGLLIPLKARYKSIYMANYYLDQFLLAVEMLKPTSLHAPKHILQNLLAEATHADFSSVISLRTGGCMIPYRMCKEWKRSHGFPSDCVGGGIHFASDPRELMSDQTVGELLPNLEAKVVDQNGNALARGQSGEIWIRNPFAMKRYLDKPAATKELFSSDGFIKTGDIGMVNERGQWYILGRNKDLFKNNGSHVMASEIEEALTTHPEVLEAVIVPVTLAQQQDDEPVPRGYIVRRAGSTLTVDDLLKWMFCQLSSKLYLDGAAEFPDALPLSTVSKPVRVQEYHVEIKQGGKVHRSALRDRAAKDIRSVRGPKILLQAAGPPSAPLVLVGPKE